MKTQVEPASFLNEEDGMTLQEVCENFHLDEPLMIELVRRGVFSAENFSDGDVCHAALACFLHESGLSAECIAVYFQTQDGGKSKRILLRRLRSEALERAHAEQRRVDKLDCLLRKLDEKDAQD